MKYFNKNDLITVDSSAGKHFAMQAVYSYGEKFELSIITNDNLTFEYCLFFCGHEGYIKKWPKNNLTANDVDNLMCFMVGLTGHKPQQV